MCLYPRIIKNRKYIANKKNGGKVPEASDPRILAVPIGCGNCMECRKQKSRGWQVRLQEDIKTNRNGKFVTLTFNNNAIEELSKYTKEKNNDYEKNNEIARIATRRFLERWRKKYKKSVRHWLVTELGQNGSERIHIHGILWTNETEEISKIWQYGIITIGERKYDISGKQLNNYNIGYVNERTINYITKYITKKDEKHKEYKSIILCSSGIGRNYTKQLNAKNNKYKESKTNELYKTRNGTKLNLPTYYRNNIYTEEEREKLWLEKLDKQIRYVNGTPIDVTKGTEEYYKALESARSLNKRLGYGDRENWKRENYEIERQIINGGVRFGEDD